MGAQERFGLKKRTLDVRFAPNSGPNSAFPRMSACQASIRRLTTGLAISFVVAFLAIVLKLRWLRAAGFLPFVFYRLLLGATLLLWIA